MKAFAQHRRFGSNTLLKLASVDALLYLDLDSAFYDSDHKHSPSCRTGDCTTQSQYQPSKSKVELVARSSFHTIKDLSW